MYYEYSKVSLMLLYAKGQIHTLNNELKFFPLQI